MAVMYLAEEKVTVACRNTVKITSHDEYPSSVAVLTDRQLN